MERELYEKLLSYLPSSSMEMETLMKRPEVTLKDVKDAATWKTRVIITCWKQGLLASS